MASRPKSKNDDGAPLDIIQLTQGHVDVFLLGMSPMIQNRMAEKAKRDLLLPRGRLNAAEKAGNLKHEPLSEYRASVYRIKGQDNPTLIGMPATAFKGAMRTAATRLPGVARTEVDQLIWVQGYSIAIYGVPQLRMDVVRMADISKTPDIRTRAILPEWCCRLTISYVMPMITLKAAANLLAGGGIVSGVGDFRQEKGKGNYGMFELVSADDERWARIAASGGRAAQLAALQDPAYWDDESEELFIWYEEEILRRGRQEAVDQYRTDNEEAMADEEVEA